MADLSRLSTEDLLALQSGDLSKVSTAGLMALQSGGVSQEEKKPITVQQKTDSVDYSSPFTAVAEPVLQMGTGLVGSVFGGLSGLLGGGDSSDRARRVQSIQEAMTYQPRTKAGQVVSRAIAYPFEKANQALGYAGEVVGGDAGRAIGESIIPVAGTVVPGMQALSKAGRVAKSNAASKQVEAIQADPAKFAAAQAARDLGITIDPSIVNPTTVTRTVSAIVPKETRAAVLSRSNEGKWTKIAKNEMGIPSETPLTLSEFSNIRSKYAAPMEAISSIDGVWSSADAIVPKLEAMRPTSLIAGEGKAAAINGIIDSAIKNVQAGMEPKLVLENIRKLREDANSVFRSPNADILAKAQADTSLSVANVLEGLVERELAKSGNSQLLGQYRDARKAMAKSYAYESAFDANTQMIDPKVIAKMTKKDNALTGDIAKIGKVAGVMPEVATLGAELPSGWQTHLSRTGPTGVAGALIGSTMGPVGAGVGGVVGAGLGRVAEAVAARTLRSPMYQSMFAPKQTALLSEMPPPVPQPLSLAPVGTPLTQTASATAPVTRGLLSLADDAQTGASGLKMPAVDFPLKLDVLNNPEIVSATRAFQSEALALKEILNNKYIIDKRVKADARAKLNAVEDEFMAGLRQLGYKNEAEVRNLMRKLYESSGETQLPIERTFNPRGMMKQ